METLESYQYVAASCTSRLKCVTIVWPPLTWRASGEGKGPNNAHYMFYTDALYVDIIKQFLHQVLLAPPRGQRRPPPPIALFVRVILKYKRPLHHHKTAHP